MNPQEPNILSITDTPKPGEYGIVLRVPDHLMGTFTMPTPGSTTYGTCLLPGKVRAHEATLAAMVFTFNKGGGDGYHAFYFMTPRTGGGMAFNTYTKLLPSMWWPPVLSTVAYDRTSDDNYVLSPVYDKDSYTGPVLVTVTEFYSQTPHDITATTFFPEVFDDYLRVVGNPSDVRGRLQLPRCLRSSLSLTVLITPYTVSGVTYTQASITIPATNPTTAPSTLVIGDDQEQVAGGWLRRKLTAARPY